MQCLETLAWWFRVLGLCDWVLRGLGCVGISGLGRTVALLLPPLVTFLTSHCDPPGPWTAGLLASKLWYLGGLEHLIRDLL